MKIPHGGRASGKTAYAILESARTGYPILAWSAKRADELVSRAKEMGVKIPYPVFFTGERQRVTYPVIADDFERVFQDYVRREFGTTVSVGTVGSPIKLIAFDSEITASDEDILDFMRPRKEDFETRYMGRWDGTERRENVEKVND